MSTGIHKAIQLHPDDNVVVCIQTLSAREEILIAGKIATIAATIGIGHKLACKPIRQGEPIIKYGAPIGVATAPIQPGAHVHTHNMKSNYIETYLIQ
jgi:hypothetical protein